MGFPPAYITHLVIQLWFVLTAVFVKMWFLHVIHSLSITDRNAQWNADWFLKVEVQILQCITVVFVLLDLTVILEKQFEVVSLQDVVSFQKRTGTSLGITRTRVFKNDYVPHQETEWWPQTEHVIFVSWWKRHTLRATETTPLFHSRNNWRSWRKHNPVSAQWIPSSLLRNKPAYLRGNLGQTEANDREETDCLLVSCPCSPSPAAETDDPCPYQTRKDLGPTAYNN